MALETNKPLEECHAILGAMEGTEGPRFRLGQTGFLSECGARSPQKDWGDFCGDPGYIWTHSGATPISSNQVDPSKDALIHEAGEVANLIAISNFDRADEAFRNLIKDYPNTPFVHYAYGEILEGLSRYDEAEREFRAEIKITPESAMPYMQLAFIELRMHRPREAQPLAEQAVKLTPRPFAAHYLLGRTLLELGKAQPAIQEPETARQYEPSSPEVRYNLSRAYAKANRKGEAERERAEFARLNALLQREQQGSGQSYQTSGDRGKLEPREVSSAERILYQVTRIVRGAGRDFGERTGRDEAPLRLSGIARKQGRKHGRQRCAVPGEWVEC